MSSPNALNRKPLVRANSAYLATFARSRVAAAEPKRANTESSDICDDAAGFVMVRSTRVGSEPPLWTSQTTRSGCFFDVSVGSGRPFSSRRRVHMRTEVREVPMPSSRSAKDRASSGALCRANMLLERHTVSW